MKIATKHNATKFIISLSILTLMSGCGSNPKNMSSPQAQSLEKTALKTYQQKAPTEAEKKAGNKALKELHQAAAQKNVYAEYRLGRYMVATGQKNTASSLIEAAANQDSPGAEFLLALMYGQGYGTLKQDAGKEATWLVKAANNHYPRAELLLAVSYIKGAHGVQKNSQQGYFYMRKAAHAGFPAAQYLLYTMYENGTHGAPQDPEKSQYWAQKVESGQSKFAGIVRRQQAQKAIVQEEDATNSGPDTGRFTTDCDNMSCVRRYSNGAVIHFTACMNPGDMDPMDNAPVKDGIGACSGTDADGNFYGMGSFN